MLNEKELDYGILIWCKDQRLLDLGIERVDILYQDGSLLGGLHCGTTIELWVDDQWVTARIEFNGKWYFYGIPEYTIEDLMGAKVRTGRYW